jgi:hypothetical protein
LYVGAVDRFFLLSVGGRFYGFRVEKFVLSQKAEGFLLVEVIF